MQDSDPVHSEFAIVPGVRALVWLGPVPVVPIPIRFVPSDDDDVWVHCAVEMRFVYWGR